MVKYKVSILGCGAIFSRHLSAIKNNPEHFKLIGIYDPINELKTKYATELNVFAYASEEDAIKDCEVNCVAILSPNHLHYLQARTAIANKKHVILEKPATFLTTELDELNQAAKENGVEIYAVLQVRLNPAVIIAKKVFEMGLFGKVRSVSLIQRWQRPLDYFSFWRGSQKTGGGILREFGIHYLDILQYLVGMPSVNYASFFNTKFYATDVSDTVYGLLDFGQFGGSFEISIAAEPRNLECSLSIMTDKGFLKLGGKSLDEIIIVDFIDAVDHERFNLVKDEVNARQTAALVQHGASPYHPELYRQIVINPERFALKQTYNVIKLVEEAYNFRSK